MEVDMDIEYDVEWTLMEVDVEWTSLGTGSDRIGFVGCELPNR